MNLMLPSGTDIYLTGGKSHDSEIRLAKFLVNHLEPGKVFLDIGAHYGYFSQLAASLVGDQGQVFSFEASPSSFNILVENKKGFQNMHCFNRAVSDSNEDIVFYEFPNLYSEYNSIYIEQYKNEPWYEHNLPKETKVQAIRLEDFLAKRKIGSCFIKIDVEGAEDKVVSGLKHYLPEHSPLIALEYLSSQLGNQAHQKAEDILRSHGFRAYSINATGALEELISGLQYLDSSTLDSDNIVFKKLA